MEAGSSREEKRPFGLRDKVGYLFGDFGNDFSFIYASTYLMVFYMKVLGIDGAVVGLLFLLARCLDAFTDVTMGRIADRMRPVKAGRFKPWLARMTVPVAVSSSLMYLYFVKDYPYTVRLVYMVVSYLLWGSFFYTSINIPYGSMASVISAEPQDRTALSTFRSMGAAFASMVINFITPLVVYTEDAEGNQLVIPKNFLLLGIVFGLCAVACHLLCYKLCTERVELPKKEKTKKGQVFRSLGKLFGNTAFLAVIGAALLMLLATLISSTMNSYLFLDYFKNTKYLSAVGLFGTGGMFLVVPFISKLTGRYGKKKIGAAGLLFSGSLYLLLFFLRIKNPLVFVVMLFFAMTSLGLFNMISFAYVSDVIDYHELKTGNREDGTVYAAYSFSRKLGQALAGGLGGFLLSAIGYVPEAAVQAEQVRSRIYMVSTAIPAACYLIAFVLMAFVYPLTRERVLENGRELKRRREEGA